jgi:aspartate/methionine/tyrosine aminotransferase
VLRLLNEARVLVHPGYFFDLHAEAYLVLSLLPSPDVFGEGVARLLRLVAERQS